MVQGRVLGYVDDGVTGTSAVVGDAVDDAGEAGVDTGPGTHRAGLDGNVERTTREVPVAERLPRPPDSDDLGMGRGVVVSFAQVVGADDDTSLRAGDDAADGNLALRSGEASLGEGLAHVVFVGFSS